MKDILDVPLELLFNVLNPSLLAYIAVKECPIVKLYETKMIFFRFDQSDMGSMVLCVLNVPFDPPAQQGAVSRR